jgi:hypothetical protein
MLIGPDRREEGQCICNHADTALAGAEGRERVVCLSSPTRPTSASAHSLLFAPACLPLSPHLLLQPPPLCLSTMVEATATTAGISLLQVSLLAVESRGHLVVRPHAD